MASRHRCDKPTSGCVFGGTGILVVLNPDGTPRWEFEVPGDIEVLSGAPAIAADGTLYVVSTCAGELYALKTSSMGLASSSWPREYHDNRNTAESTTPLPSMSACVGGVSQSVSAPTNVANWVTSSAKSMMSTCGSSLRLLPGRASGPVKAEENYKRIITALR